MREETKKKISETCKKNGVGKWMKDRKLPEETCQKMSENSARYWLSKKRPPISDYHKKRITETLSGKQRTEETKRKISQNNCRYWLGKKRPKFSEETLKRMSISQRNRKERKPISIEHKQKLSEAMKGEKNHKWIEDRTKIIGRHNRNFHDSDYKQWRMQVWMRDGFKCKMANENCVNKIEAHHILGWKLYPELRYKINNGITLCHAHHPRRRAEEKRLIPVLQGLVSVSNV